MRRLLFPAVSSRAAIAGHEPGFAPGEQTEGLGIRAPSAKFFRFGSPPQLRQPRKILPRVPAVVESRFRPVDAGEPVLDQQLVQVAPVRGGSANYTAVNLNSADRLNYESAGLDYNSGFRVASVPEPASAVLLLSGMALLGLRRRRSVV